MAAGYMAGGAGTLIGTGYVTWPIPQIDSVIYDSLLSDTTTYGQKTTHGANITVSSANANTKAPYFSLFPNPTYGTAIIKTSMDGIFILQSMDGKQISQYPLAAGNNSIELPRTLAEGIYMGTFKPSDGSKPIITRLVYQP